MTDFTKIPFNNIIKFGQDTMLDKDLFSVSWILGRFCNYSCSYCWPYANSNKPDHQTLQVYTDTIISIKRQAKENGFKKFHWSFSGGEPTAYRNLLTLISMVSDSSIHMTTNLSPGLHFWDKYLEYSKDCTRRSITASFHHEFADEQEFGDKILYLMKNGVLVTINQVMVPDKFYELRERCIRFHNRGINVTLKPQTDPTASKLVEGYDEMMLTYMRTGFPQHVDDKEVLQVKLIDKENNVYYIDQAERLNSFGFNSFTGWNCNSGYQSIVIRENEVKRSYSCHDKILGTLTEGFQLFDSPVPCITPTCMSSADSKIPKCLTQK